MIDGTMDFYRLFKRILGLKSPRVKLLMLAAGRLAGMRYVGVFVDPVMACNIKCRMCYFSDPASRPKPQGLMSRTMIDALARSVFPRALKVQIGCGAEPTVYKDLVYLIEAARKARVPYIEMTTNGQLLTYESVSQAVESGLGGITLSLHGTTAATYEYLMEGASFARFREVVDMLGRIQHQYPAFKLRVNYTACNMNKAELAGLWSLFGHTRIDILQVRPIQRVGDTAYNDFDIDDHDGFMRDVIDPVAAECRRRGTIALLPTRDNVENVNKLTSRANALIEEFTYCYVTPQKCYRDDFVTLPDNRDEGSNVKFNGFVTSSDSHTKDSNNGTKGCNNRRKDYNNKRKDSDNKSNGILLTPPYGQSSDLEHKSESIAAYQSRTGMTKRLYKAILGRGLSDETAAANTTKKLNYK